MSSKSNKASSSKVSFNSKDKNNKKCDYNDDNSSQAPPPQVVLPKRKLVIVGDAECGESFLLYFFKHNSFFEEYIPTVFENSVTDVFVEKYSTKIELCSWDTAGGVEHERLIPLSFGETDVVLLCYSVVDPLSFLNIPAKWSPQVKHFCPKVPVMLVGTKIDLREDPYIIDYLERHCKTPILTAEGNAMATRIGARCFVECSAKNGDGVSDLFQEAAQLAYKYGLKRHKHSICATL